MTSLVLVWTTVICSAWTSGSAQVQSQKRILYPKLDSEETLLCECVTYDSVLWFRSLKVRDQLQFLVSINTASRVTHGKNSDGLNTKRFSAKMKGTGLCSLSIANVTPEDAGVYSCVVKGKNTENVWTPGILLLPGESPPPTMPLLPKPKPEVPVCPCLKNSKKKQPKGCDSVIMWPLAGILAALFTALLSTLYYFSRLPKKCRHHFVRKRLMS